MSRLTDHIVGRADRTPAVPDLDEAWEALSAPRPQQGTGFDPATLAELPDPARRWLIRAVPAGVSVDGAVVAQMEGELRLGRRWFDFRAEQILRPGIGFVWRPVVGGRLVRFTGGDLLVGSQARMVFKFRGLVPVVDASDEDVALSAAGRLAGETIVWAPQSLTPGAGARWTAVDGERAIVTVVADGREIDVEVTVDGGGVLRSLRFDRWNASAAPPANEPFGGPATREFVTSDGLTICGSGSAGWGWGTPTWPDGEFFRYRIVGWQHVP